MGTAPPSTVFVVSPFAVVARRLRPFSFDTLSPLLLLSSAREVGGHATVTFDADDAAHFQGKEAVSHDAERLAHGRREGACPAASAVV